MTTEPSRSRAVFSTEDFSLMKEAVASYVKQIADDPPLVQVLQPLSPSRPPELNPSFLGRKGVRRP